MSSDPARDTAATAAAAAPSALRAYRYALNPTPARVEDLQRPAGAARGAFNHAIAANVAAHRVWRARVDEFDEFDAERARLASAQLDPTLAS